MIWKSKDSELSCRVDYQRKSGDANTSLGNTLVNAIVFRTVFRGQPVSTAFMLGDDNLFGSNKFYSKEDIIEKYATFGLVVKVEVHTNILNSKFL